MVALTTASLAVAAGALVFAWRMRNANRALRLAGRAVEAHSLHLEKEVVQLERSLPFDALTGLGNALRLEEDWRRLVARFERRREPFSLALIDVDAADGTKGSLERTSLADIAETLLAVVRAEDHVYRLGHESFAVLLSGSDLQGARAFVDRTRQRLTAIRNGDATRAHCSVVFGTSEWEKKLTGLAALLAEAAKDRDRSRAPALMQRSVVTRLARTSAPKSRAA